MRLGNEVSLALSQKRAGLYGARLDEFEQEGEAG